MTAMLKGRSLLLGLSIAGLLLLSFQTVSADKQPDDPLAGKRFGSVKKLESGLSPNGVALGHWIISFRDGRFSWSHSDVSEGGTYRYDPRTGTVTGIGTSKSRYQGKYDPKSGELTWEKQKYKVIR